MVKPEPSSSPIKPFCGVAVAGPLREEMHREELYDENGFLRAVVIY